VRCDNEAVAEADLRQFMHGLLARFEKLAEGMHSQLSAQTRAMLEQATAMREQAAAMRAQAATMREQETRLKDFGDEVRAHRDGLLEVLDHIRRADGTT
jgi:predicted secreted protein